MLKIGIIGFGGMGEYHARSIIPNSPQFTVGGIYDISAERCKLAKEQYNYTVYPDSQALFDDKTIDVVLIATPNDLHCPYALQAAAAKKHFICEKPVAMNSHEVDVMQAAAEKNNVIFTVHQNRRWDEDYRTARAIIESGKLGKVYKIESNVMGANGIPGGWRKLPEYGGGMMLDWGVHLVDQIFDFITKPLKSLSCKYSHALGFEVDDGFELELGFEGDLNVSVRVDTNSYIPLPRWKIYGRDGTAEITDWSLSGKIILPKYSDKVEIVGIKAGNGFTKTMAYRSHDSVIEQEIERVPVNPAEFYDSVAHAVTEGGKPAVDIPSVRKIMRIMELCNISDAEQRILLNPQF